MKKVSLFIPCLVDTFLPAIATAMAAILERLGVEISYHDEQTCCGQLAVNAGYRGYAIDAAKRFLTIFGEDEAIVSPAGSCVWTVKHHYPELLKDEPTWARRAEEVASRIYEFSQYVVDVLHVTDLGAHYNGKVTYHESCHILRGLGISDQPKRLLSSVSGAELVPLFASDMCCGFGGEFSTRYHFISEEMVKEKVNHFLSSGADVLVTCEPGCYLNISGYMHRHIVGKNVIHIANFLANSVRG